MKKILLLSLFVLISGVIWSQSIPDNQNNNEELIVLTKTKHDALRRDISDYKSLIIRYKSLKVEYDITIADLERQAKLSNKTLDELKKSSIKLAQMQYEIDTLNEKLEELLTKYSKLDKSYNKLNTMYYAEKGKVQKMRKDQAGVHLWRLAAIVFFVFIFIVAGNN